MNKTKFISLVIILMITFICIVFLTNFITPMQIKGDSMNPLYKDGEIVFINKVYSSVDYLDVIVFYNNSQKFIKRVIGIPGDTIVFKDGLLYRNGLKLIDMMDNVNFYDQKIVINKNEYFIAGDNLMVSLDSRQFGAIQSTSIVGKVL